MTTPVTRRRALLTGGAASLALPAAMTAPALASASTDAPFQFEVSRSLPQWLSMLSEEEFRILRLGGTEVPHSSTTWNETRAGTYHCKGCDLTVYESGWKAKLNKGWAFFRHACPNAVLTGIDGEASTTMGGEPQAGYVRGPTIEAHCRRCGSHLGHIVWVQKEILHCINGIALRFEPATT